MTQHTDQQFDALLTAFGELMPRYEESRLRLRILEVEKKLVGCRKNSQRWKDGYYKQRQDGRDDRHKAYEKAEAGERAADERVQAAQALATAAQAALRAYRVEADERIDQAEQRAAAAEDARRAAQADAKQRPRDRGPVGHG